MTEWSPGSAPTTSWSVNAGMDPSDPGVADNLASLAERAETAATNAETAETNAETAETSAETAKTAAETAKAAAETAETNAETAETNAETAEANASTSASAAASSASAASTSASTATTKASEASSSASAASTSETNASNSASAASTSATNASSSASSASTSATAAAASYDSFDDRYLGAKTSDPGADNDGNALITGALFFNSSTGVMQVYNGSQWVAAASSIEGIKSDFTYTATANQTVFSGADANSSSLVIDQAGLTSAFLNGVRLVQGTDYSINVGANSITLTAGAALNDILEVEVFGNFEGQSGASVAITGGSIAGLSALGVSGNITVTGTVDGRDVATDGTKLDGIEASATADQSAAEILTALLTVDGTGTTLDADLLDGQHGSYYTGYTDTAITNLVDSAPGALNTLNELAAALGDDVNFSTTVTNSIATKLPLAGGTLSGALNVTGTVTADENITIDTSSSGNGLTIQSSGNTYNRLTLDANRTGAGNLLGEIMGEWNGNQVGAIRISAGSDTTNKDDGKLSFLTSSDGTGIVERMSIDSTGSVNIATDTGSTALVHIDNTGQDVNDGVALKVSASNRGTGAGDAAVLGVFNTNGEIFRVQNDGKVGIGTTSPYTDAQLHISKVNAGGDNSLRIQNASTATGTTTSLKFTNTTSDYDHISLTADRDRNLIFRTSNDAVETMRITGDGNVGIGIAAPLSPLDVEASDANQRVIRISHPTSPTAAAGYFGYASDGTTDNNVVNLGVQYSSTYYDVINIQRSTRNVGIGTTAPTSGFKLEVTGDARFGDAVGDDAVELGWSSGGSQGFIQAYDRAASAFRSLNLNNSVTIDASGNVGIGVTPEAWTSGVDALQVGTKAVLSAGSTNTILGNNWYDDGANKYLSGSGALASIYSQNAGVHAWYNAPAGNADAALTFTQAMTLDANGNLSLGTDAPIYNFGDDRTTLTLKGKDSTDYSTIQLGNYGTTGNGQGLGFVNFYDGTNENARIGAYRSSNSSSGELRFYSRAQSGSLTEGMRVTSAGNVSIINGNLVVASGHGIDFSATGNSSGSVDSELLDDYEEGTWVPVATERSGVTSREIPNATYNTTFTGGWYTKIGSVVTFGGCIRLTNADPTSASWELRITGLPFTSQNRTPYGQARSAVSTDVQAGLDGLASDRLINAYININSAHIDIRYFDNSDGSGANMPASYVQDDFLINFGGSYNTSS